MQQVYISLLRGINVGGNKLIKMQQLLKLYEALHFKNATSYLQSGNVLFTAPITNNNTIAAAISEQIKLAFNFEVKVLVYSLNTFKKIMKNNPFIHKTDADTKKIYITYFSNKPSLMGIKEIENSKNENELIRITDNAAYIYFSEGYGNAKLNNNVLEKKLNVIATTRNWQTSLAILNIATKINHENIYS
jgi:uncharacterized protein (DUF1697 family)